MKLSVRAVPIAGVKLIHVEIIPDLRGSFAETYQRFDFASAGITYEFIQDNQSQSSDKGTVRGLHFQIPPHAQTKLIRVLRGRILDVIVDLRRSSPTYGKHLAIELTAASGDQLLIPAGFAHGYCTLEPDTEIFYKVDAGYSPDHDCGLNWADPALQIQWPLAASQAILSDRDRTLPILRDLPAYFE
jgi:dTDP-4-dehydrorhamnose 3,5-epimerase